MSRVLQHRRVARGAQPCFFPPRMPPRPDLGPKPRLGYSDSRLERAAELRANEAALAAMASGAQAGAYVIGGDLIVMKKGAPLNEPLFTMREAQAPAVSASALRKRRRKPLKSVTNFW
jgi:hypothetical protein